MADYSDSKKGLGAMFPKGAADSDGWKRTEPLVTPEDVRIFQLLGLPLVSAQKNPLTGKSEIVSDDILKKYIHRAVNEVELETGLDIFPVSRIEKKPYDKQEYDSFGYFRLIHRPVSSIESLEITPANGVAVYSVPKEWMDTGLLHVGQLNLIPLSLSVKTGTSSPIVAAPGGAAFMAIFGHRPWIPSFWQMQYTSGFCEAEIPIIINDLIGIVAAMRILSMLAVTHSKSQSTSLSIDGLGQSITTPGPEIYTKRLNDLTEEKNMKLRKIKKIYQLGFFSDNV